MLFIMTLDTVNGTNIMFNSGLNSLNKLTCVPKASVCNVVKFTSGNVLFLSL